MWKLLVLSLGLYAVSIIGSVQCQNCLNPLMLPMAIVEYMMEAEKNATIRGKFPLISSNELPVSLVEDKDKSLDPTEADLDADVLMKLLPKGYDPMFQSITKPSDTEENRNGILSFKLHRGRPAGTRPDFLNNFGELNIEDANGERVQDLDLKLKSGQKRKIIKFLWNYTNCPVIYKWKDLGIRFWPQWIREGTCHQEERSCSFPPGMYCKPSKSKSIEVLRYYCTQDGVSCRWINILYPLIEKCICLCWIQKKLHCAIYSTPSVWKKAVYFFGASLLHSLIKWFTVSSFPSHHHHFLICCI